MSAGRAREAARSRRFSALIGLVITGALVLGVRAVAYAHATLVSSEPAAGSRLATSPSRARLVFSEQIEPTLAQLSLVVGDGSSTHLVVSGDPHDVHALVAPVSGLASGTYRLTWRVVSADGHPVGGSFVFSVGASQMVMPPDTAAAMEAHLTWGPSAIGAPLVPAALRGLGLGSMMGLAGVLFFLGLPRGPNAPVPIRAVRLANWLALAAAVFLALHLVAWIMNVTPEHQLGGDATVAVVASAVGKVELWRTGLAVLALWALWLARRPRIALLFAVAALLVSGASGHPAAIQPLWAMPAKALHLVAGSAWLGGLLWLLAIPRDDATAFARDASRVSAIALLCMLLVALSGLVQTWLFLPSLLDLVRSSYGAVALAKIAGLVVLVGFGAFHRYRVLPRLERDATMPGRFAVSLRGEVVVMFVVVLLGGLLAYVSPPRGPEHQMTSTHSPDGE